MIADLAATQPRARNWPLRSTLIALIVASCVAYVASSEAGSYLLLATVSTARPAFPIDRGQRAIVLLTGSHPGRIMTAAVLQRQTTLPLIVAGRNAGFYFTKLREAGAQSLWSENNSTNTEQNAAYSACLLASKNIDHVFIVTDDAHMRRAVAWFKYYGVNVTPVSSGPPWPGRSPNPWLPSKIGWQRSKAVLHEWGGLVDFTVRSFLGHRLACPKPAQSGEP